MAEKHILSLEIPTVSNCEVLCVKDTSQYTTKLEVDCSELLITMPGFTAPVLIKVDEKFDLCLNACVLALQKVDCGKKRTKLPDGVYVVRYSVSPNDKVYVEYNHLRITRIIECMRLLVSNNEADHFYSTNISMLGSSSNINKKTLEFWLKA